MSCLKIRSSFSGDLDGTVGGVEMQAVAGHLESCSECRREFAQWRGIQRAVEQAGAVSLPEDLGLRLRLAISHESARRQGHWWDGIRLKWDNLLRPVLVQVSAGLASALVLTGSLVLMAGMAAAPTAVLAHDEPLGASTMPHYLYSAARLAPVTTGGDATILIQADVNEDGVVYDYTVLSGSMDAKIAAQVRDQLMVQVYEPARVFGEPVRGRVLLTFSGVSVQG